MIQARGFERWALALLGPREYLLERLAALEARSAKVFAELGVSVPIAPRREEGVEEAFSAAVKWGNEMLLKREVGRGAWRIVTGAMRS